MSAVTPTCPLPRSQVVDLYFMEHRAKLLDIAAFLDRLDRAQPDIEADPRVEVLREAVSILIDGKAQRTRRLLEHFSDPTAEPIEKAPGKGACGVYLKP